MPPRAAKECPAAEPTACPPTSRGPGDGPRIRTPPTRNDHAYRATVLTLSMRHSSPASSSFVLATLRALQLDPDSSLARVRTQERWPANTTNNGLRYAETVLTKPDSSGMPFGRDTGSRTTVVRAERSVVAPDRRLPNPASIEDQTRVRGSRQARQFWALRSSGPACQSSAELRGR
jgi:hypothetical protein